MFILEIETIEKVFLTSYRKHCEERKRASLVYFHYYALTMLKSISSSRLFCFDTCRARSHSFIFLLAISVEYKKQNTEVAKGVLKEFSRKKTIEKVRERHKGFSKESSFSVIPLLITIFSGFTHK